MINIYKCWQVYGELQLLYIPKGNIKSYKYSRKQFDSFL